MTPRVLVVTTDASAAESAAEQLHHAGLLVAEVRLEPGLGGVWTDFSPEGRETIRMGYPKSSAHAFFQVLNPKVVRTCATVAIERIAFGRRISDVLPVGDDILLHILRHALRGQHLEVWLGRTSQRPERLPLSGLDEASTSRSLGQLLAGAAATP